MHKLRSLLAALSVFLVSSFGLAVFPHATFALFNGAKDAACNGANLNDSSAGCAGSDSTGAQDKVSSVVKTAINILSFVVGVVSVIMIIIGGIRFATSQGDGSSTAAARNTIVYAIVGLVVVGIAQAIVQFVLSKAN